MDGEDKPKDALQETGQPSEEETSPSVELGRTFTSEEVDKLIRERHSILDKQIAKLNKTAAGYKSELESLKTAHQQMLDAQAQREREAYEKELEEAEGDPKLKAMLKREQAIKVKELALRQKEADLVAKEEEHKELFETASAVRQQELAKKLAAEHGIPVDVLLEFEDETPEAMEATAKRLAKLVKTEAKPPMKPYSGAGQGAGVELSPREKMKLGFDREK